MKTNLQNLTDNSLHFLTTVKFLLPSFHYPNSGRYLTQLGLSEIQIMQMILYNTKYLRYK